MKQFYQLISLCAILFFSTNIAKAQDSKAKVKNSDNSEKCFDENTHIVNVGAGFGTNRYYDAYRGYGYTYKSSPAISATYEQAYPKKLGIGYLGIGAYLGYQRSSSTYNYYYGKIGYNNYYYYKYSWNNIMLGARGVYHFDILNAKNAEVYVGVLAGIRIQTYNYSTNNPDPSAIDYRLSTGSVFPSVSAFAGARWYFAHNVALFGEVGYGISYLTGGVSFKF